MILGCAKAKAPVYPLDYDKSKTIAPMRDGKLHGMRKAYRGNGTIIALTSYKNGKKDGVEKTYDRHGDLVSEVSWKKDKREGLTKEWKFTKHKIIESSITPYKNGKKDGVAIEYYADGKVMSKTPYVNGKKQGLYESWYSDGNQRRMTPYKDDKVEGVMKHFDNGKLTYIGSYKNGEKYGIHKSYYNGHIQEAVPYVKGKLHGTGEIYDEDGSLKYRLTWVDGYEKEIVYSQKEKEKMAQAKLRRDNRVKRSKGGAVALRCSFDSNHASMSEVSRKTAIAKGRGEGAALGYQMKTGSISTGRVEASNYCTQNVNIENMSCRYAEAYLSGCMSKFGY
jgi:antitoxin component YwqK of YwqJK toxin-antitoxin module